MEANTAIFNAKEKTITFNFADEEFVVDLTEGDLEDSWNGITTKTGQVYDFNFSWQENEEPAMSLYKVKEDNSTDFFDSESVKIIAQIGNFKDYFGYEEGHYEAPKKETTSFRVDFTAYLIVDGVSSLAEAQEKVKLMEVDFNDTNVEQIM